MRTLTIIPEHHDTGLKMKGLSIKSAGYAGHDLCRYEWGGYFIENRFYVNGRTAQIEVKKLVSYLKELHEELPFDNIKIKGNYEKTGEELMKLILEQ